MTTLLALSPGVSHVVLATRIVLRRFVMTLACLSIALVVTTPDVANAATSSLLLRNTFLGGSADDLGNAIAVDASGNVYVAGSSTASWGAPVRPYSPTSSAFVAKLNAEGTLLWNTFLNRSTSSAVTTVNEIAVDANGNVYVTGESNGTWGAPVRAITTGTQRDAFAAKLDPSGVLLWNTFLGGAGDDGGRGIGVDNTGHVYVAGTSPATWGSPVMRAHTASNDAFLVRLAPNGSIVWNTFLGGTGVDTSMGMSVDNAGNAYVTGVTTANWGAPISAYTNLVDGFVVKVSSTGVLVWNTFVGGPLSRDMANGIATDGTSVYVTGSSTDTWGNPLRLFTPRPAGVPGSFADAFVAKLSVDGIAAWNTFLGGSADDTADSVSFDRSGNVYVAGSSTATWAIPAIAFVGGPALPDAFAAKLDSNGVLLLNAFLGGAAMDVGTGIAVDSNGNAHVSGYSGATWGTPTRPFSVGSVRDAFVATLGSEGDDEPPVLSLPDLITAEATVAGGALVEWTASAVDAHDGEVSVQCTPDGGSLFELGVTVVNCSATDAAGNEATGSFQVMVVDTTAPVVASITASPNVLGPPNHKMIPVVVTVRATDGTDASPTAKIVRVTSNEAVNGTGDGDTAPDWLITGPLTLQLRAERAGKTQDRVYTITVEVKDRSGNATPANVQVIVRR